MRTPVAIPSNRLAGGDRNLRPVFRAELSGRVKLSARGITIELSRKIQHDNFISMARQGSNVMDIFEICPYGWQGHVELPCTVNTMAADDYGVVRFYPGYAGFSARSLTHWPLMTPYGVTEIGQLTLVQVMACCLTASNHYPNQCWRIISEILDRGKCGYRTMKCVLQLRTWNCSLGTVSI